LDRQSFEDLIRDAEWRIGSYIATGGNSTDEYVQEQIRKIRDWNQQMADLERNVAI
jgi:hypothetical protein